MTTGPREMCLIFFFKVGDAGWGRGYRCLDRTVGYSVFSWLHLETATASSKDCFQMKSLWGKRQGFGGAQRRCLCLHSTIIFRVNILCVLFRSAQDDIYSLGKAHMRSTPSFRSSPNIAFETVPMFTWLTMTLSRPFKEDLSSASSFRASLLQTIDGVMSLALCPQVVSRASQHFRSSEKQSTCEGCMLCPPVYLLKLWTCNCLY